MAGVGKNPGSTILGHADKQQSIITDGRTAYWVGARTEC